MKPVYKSVPHDPQNEQWGDCYRACIATLLSFQPATVPHVFHRGDFSGGIPAMRAWLATLDCDLLSFPIAGDVESVFACMQKHNPDIPYLLMGLNGENIGHAVIARGNKIVHDPNVDKPGVVNPFADGTFVVQVIVPRRASFDVFG